LLEENIRECGLYDRLGPSRDMISSIFTSVNKFVRHDAEGDIIKYSRVFGKPKDFVEEIARNIERMDGPFRDKVWIYMRWMVRPKPDLRIFDHFSPENLNVPLTGNMARVAACLGLIDSVEPSLWEDENKAVKARERITCFAKQLFPRDPAKVDYPFFLLGRWLKGRDLNINTLKEALRFFAHLQKVTGHPHSFYQSISRYKSGWEEKTANVLRKMKIPYSYELIRFPLPGGISYTPDFIINKSKQGRKILLEPHYELTEKDAHKFSLFKQTYGHEFLLILLLKNDYIPYFRARNLLTDDLCDDVWPIEFVHVLAEKIRTGAYDP